MTQQAILRSIWLRAVAYMLLVGGGWLVILPLLILRLEFGSLAIYVRTIPLVATGLMGFAAGVFLASAAGYHLIRQGHGTPFPLDPTRRLVTRGPYAYVRNPQGIAMMLMVAGETLALQSRFVWLLLPLTLVYLEVLVGPWEERELLRRYGEQYAHYRRQVRKWIPRFQAYHAHVRGT